MINAMEMEMVEGEPKIHESHEMSKWESCIVACARNDRFGQVRGCEKCEGRDVKAGGAGSRYVDEELLFECGSL